MALNKTQKFVAATSILALLTGCAEPLASYGEAGKVPNNQGWGGSVQNNVGIHTGAISYVVSLAERFNREVPDTVNFAFNSAQLDAGARAILDQQAHFIRQFPEVRFRVYGHTDLVGSSAYNRSLGLRRAQAVVAYMGSRGVSRSRLEAVVSYGETRPLVNTADRERRNRRTVTEVSGFVEDAPLILNGKYAAVIAREYVASATELPPRNTNAGVEAAGGD